MLGLKDLPCSKFLSYLIQSAIDSISLPVPHVSCFRSPSDITFLGTAVSATPSGSVNNCPLSNKVKTHPLVHVWLCSD